MCVGGAGGGGQERRGFDREGGAPALRSTAEPCAAASRTHPRPGGGGGAHAPGHCRGPSAPRRPLRGQVYATDGTRGPGAGGGWAARARLFRPELLHRQVTGVGAAALREIFLCLQNGLTEGGGRVGVRGRVRMGLRQDLVDLG